MPTWFLLIYFTVCSTSVFFLSRTAACEQHNNREALINQCFITLHVGCVMFGCGVISHRSNTQQLIMGQRGLFTSVEKRLGLNDERRPLISCLWL